MTGEPTPASSLDVAEPNRDGVIGEMESALHSLLQALKQVRLQEHLLDKAGVDVDRAGMAMLYVLNMEETNLRVTDLADHLRIDAPAVTRKAQQLERSGLIHRIPDRDDARAIRLQLTGKGRRTIKRILAARRVWLTSLLGDWPQTDQIEFSRLLRLFTSCVDRQLKELDV